MLNWFRRILTKRKPLNAMSQLELLDSTSSKPILVDNKPQFENDFIHRLNQRYGRDTICRVRVINGGENNYIFLTDLGNRNTGASVTNTVEHIILDLKAKYLLPENPLFIEHYENTFGRSTFDVVTLDIANHPTWKSHSRDEIRLLIGDEVDQFLKSTYNDPVISQKIERVRRMSDPKINDTPIKLSERKRADEQLFIFMKCLSVLVEEHAGEATLQKMVKDNLDIIGQAFACSPNEYIAFSEFPLFEGRVDFVVFTGRSRLEIILVEIKGANFNFLTTGSYNNISAKANEACQQMRTRLGEISRDMKSFGVEMHSIRQLCEDGEKKATLGEFMPLQVDPNKDVIVTGVVIAGRSTNDRLESKLRHEYEADSHFRVRIETWESWMRRHGPKIHR